MLAIHPNARTTPLLRAEIAGSVQPTGELAKRFGVSTATVRTWRKRGAADCRDRSSRPHQLPWRASEEERAVVCALRRATGFPLDDLTFVVTHFLPQLNRDAVYRLLRAEGLGRLPRASRPRQLAGAFRAYDPGLVHLAVKDDETEASARAMPAEALAAFPFRVTHALTDRGACFTAEGFETACRRLGVEHRKGPALHAAHPRDGRALQRPGPARGARHHRRRPRRPRAPAGGLQLGRQCPSPARPGRALARGGRP